MLEQKKTIMLEQNDLSDLKKAKQLLENPGLAMKITNYIGKPIEKGLESLPKNWSDKISNVTKEALMKIADIASFTMDDKPKVESSNFLHKLTVGTTGAVGGFFGLAGLAIELPTSTGIMFRSIMDIARENGESTKEISTKLACLEVFALGGKSDSDDGAESAYFATRTMLAKSVTDALKYLTEKTIVEEGAPIMVRFIAKIAERFSIQVGEKALSQAVPVVGAGAGAIINVMFMDHFQDMATGHFTIRRLERKYGEENIKEMYYKI